MRCFSDAKYRAKLGDGSYKYRTLSDNTSGNKIRGIINIQMLYEEVEIVTAKISVRRSHYVWEQSY